MSQGHYILDTECQKQLQNWAKDYGWHSISPNISIYDSSRHYYGSHEELKYPEPLEWKPGRVISVIPNRKYPNDKHWVLLINGGYTHRNDFLRTTPYGKKYERLSMFIFLGTSEPDKTVIPPLLPIRIMGERHIRTGSMDMTAMMRSFEEVKEYNEPITYPRIVTCPHCKDMIEITSVNCGIFRHAIRQKPGENAVQEPHASKDTLADWKEKGWLIGCGLPFVIDKNTHEVKAVDVYN